jgi:hypothetical protein
MAENIRAAAIERLSQGVHEVIQMTDSDLKSRYHVMSVTTTADWPGHAFFL